jgi:RNA polymerase-binding transcription factor
MSRSRRTTVRTVHRESAGRSGDPLVVRLPALRAALERQRRFRREQLAELDAVGRSPADNAEPPDPRDEQAVYGLCEVDTLVAAGARQALADIDLALVRVATGRYGYCRSCGARIPLVVLQAIPRTTLCLACQQHE